MTNNVVYPTVTQIAFEGVKPTYNAGVIANTFAANATALAKITGSATATIKIRHIQLSGTTTAGIFENILLIKRTTPNVGGTTTNITASSNDSFDPSCSAVLSAYTVNPTSLGAGAIARADNLCFPAVASAYPSSVNTWEFGTCGDKAMTLRGVNESIELNWNGQAIPVGLSIAMDISWTEE